MVNPVDVTATDGEFAKLRDCVTEVRDAVRDAVATMQHQQSLCGERMGVVHKHIENIHKTLYGNGREGLDDRVKGLETTAKGLESIIKRLNDGHSRMSMGTGSISVKAMVLILGAAGSFVGAIVGALVPLIQVLMR